MKKIFYFFLLCTSVSVAQKNSLRTNSIACLPVAAVCNPTTLDSATSAGLGIGITFVGLNQIQNTSTGQSTTLEEYTCTDSTSLNIAQAYAFEVHTGLVYEETVTAWIDFSNDGAFVPQEIVFHDSAQLYMHTGFVTIPSGAINTFTPIRMRVGSDYTGNPGLNACANPLYGQYEDYKIYYGVNISVDEPENKIQLTLYPNPIHESATLVISGNEGMKEMELNIYNSFGQLIRADFFDNSSIVKIERRNLPVGFYFYSVGGKGEIKASGKFIVD
jgi:hypothetical protein